MQQTTGANAVARALAEAGVQWVFSLSGNQILDLYDALLDTGIKLIHTRHEAAAGHMADAWGRLTEPTRRLPGDGWTGTCQRRRGGRCRRRGRVAVAVAEWRQPPGASRTRRLSGAGPGRSRGTGLQGRLVCQRPSGTTAVDRRCPGPGCCRSPWPGACHHPHGYSSYRRSRGCRRASRPSPGGDAQGEADEAAGIEAIVALLAAAHAAADTRSSLAGPRTGPA